MIVVKLLYTYLRIQFFMIEPSILKYIVTLFVMPLFSRLFVSVLFPPISNFTKALRKQQYYSLLRKLGIRDHHAPTWEGYCDYCIYLLYIYFYLVIISWDILVTLGRYWLYWRILNGFVGGRKFRETLLYIFNLLKK